MNAKGLIKSALPAALMLGALAVIALKVDWRGMTDIVRDGDLLLIGLAVLVASLRFVVWSWKWKKTLSPLAEISFSRTLSILMTGIFINQVTPGRDTGGEPARAYYVSKFTGIPKRQAFATIILDKSGNYIAISTFIAYSILFITLFIKIPSNVKAILEGVLLFFALAFLSALYVKKNLHIPGMPSSVLRKVYYFPPLSFLRNRFTTYSMFENHVMERLSEFMETLRDLVKDRRNIVHNIALSYLIWFMVFLKTYLIFLAFDQRVSMLMVVAVESISILFGVISFLPGGVGATEVTMIALFRSAGISVELATAVTLLSRGIYYALTLGLGYLSYLYLKVSQGVEADDLT